MAQAFTGNATLTTASANATSLLAVSNIVFAGNGTIQANGTATAWFDSVLTIVPSDPANLTLIAASSAAQAANVPASLGMKCVSGGVLTISPGWVLACTQGNITRADAGNVYVATSANQTLTISGY